MVRVEIDVYMPEGWSQTHYVETDDRGAAITRAMKEHSQGELKYVNNIAARLCSDQEPIDVEARRLFLAQCEEGTPIHDATTETWTWAKLTDEEKDKWRDKALRNGNCFLRP